jgi:hypothetical protein
MQLRRMILGAWVVAAVLWLASAASAGGLNLAWNNCASEGGVQARLSDCLSNSGSNTLTGSFVPLHDITGVTGIEIVLDFIVGDGVSPIPPWWEMNGVGSCRQGSLTSNGIVNSANTLCGDWADGAALGGLAAYNGVSIGGKGNPLNWPARRTAVLGYAVAAENAADLSSTQEYFVFNLVIQNVKTVGAGACAGCLQPACIVINSMNLVPGVNAGQLIGSGTSAGSNFAIWQTSAPNCSLVPTKRSNWGAVKQLYR